MKTQYKLKSHVTREWLENTKWGISDWTDEQKTLWQKACFHEGIGWFPQTYEVYALDNDAYFVLPEELLHSKGGDFINDAENDELILKTFEDMFEPIEQEHPSSCKGCPDCQGISCDITEQACKEELSPVGLKQPQTSVKPEQYKWVKKDFEHSWEALRAFTEGVELYFLDDFVGENTYEKITCPYMVVGHFEQHKALYTKVVTPWYELVSEEKPCYVYDGWTILKIVGATKNSHTTACDKLYRDRRVTPLTKQQVEDIVSVMEGWYETSD
ncbi:MAG: hypothetical protein GY928_31190 [Colwellia sp.]|nr:hypothetical protein [Colwellia sp.]